MVSIVCLMWLYVCNIQYNICVRSSCCIYLVFICSSLCLLSISSFSPFLHTTPTQFTVIDAGYTATDYAIAKVLFEPNCRWVSLSNGDNAYGSRVVENVLHGEWGVLCVCVCGLLL